jgi:TonB family protein
MYTLRSARCLLPAKAAIFDRPPQPRTLTEGIDMARKMAMTLLALLVMGAVAWAQAGGAKGAEPKVDKVEKKDVTEPVVIEKVSPKYPEEAKKEKVQGAVTLEAFIEKDGTVSEVTSVKEADARLVKAAIEAVKQWKFKPAMTKSGQAVRVKTTLTINFKLQ